LGLRFSANTDPGESCQTKRVDARRFNLGGPKTFPIEKAGLFAEAAPALVRYIKKNHRAGIKKRGTLTFAFFRILFFIFGGGGGQELKRSRVIEEEQGP